MRRLDSDVTSRSRQSRHYVFSGTIGFFKQPPNGRSHMSINRYGDYHQSSDGSECGSASLGSTLPSVPKIPSHIKFDTANRLPESLK
jgi:hypothetical protein